MPEESFVAPPTRLAHAQTLVFAAQAPQDQSRTFSFAKEVLLVSDNKVDCYLFMLAHELLLRLFEFASLLVNFGVKNGFHFLLHFFHFQPMLTELGKNMKAEEKLTAFPRSSARSDSWQKDFWASRRRVSLLGSFRSARSM